MGTAQIVMAVIAYLLAGLLCMGYAIRWGMYSVYDRDKECQKFLTLIAWPICIVVVCIMLVVEFIDWLAEQVAGK
jgi:uncharacterized membrane protein